jgi:hypothetical protein
MLIKLSAWSGLKNKMPDIVTISRLIIPPLYLRETDNLGDPGIDRRIILRSIFRQWEVGVWTRSRRPRIGKGGGHL